MSALRFEHRSRMPATAEEVFDWHLREGAFERLAPPFDPAEVVAREGGVADGGTVELRLGPLRQRWLARHTDFEPGRLFRDVQEEGPFARWEHTHEVIPADGGACELVDRIDYDLPGGALGRMVAGGFVRERLERVFAYRHETLRGDLEARRRRGRTAEMKVAVTGSTGLVGHSLVAMLRSGGDSVIRLVRHDDVATDEVRWDPDGGAPDPNLMAGVDAVVHLAGENIAGKRWNAKVKRRIRDSRVNGTRTIAEAVAKLERKPEVLVCASAIGFYGDRGDEELTEDSEAGSGFLADVCEEWERAADPAREAGIRVVHARFGVVLSPLGGALEKMLTPFKAGAGGVIGSGRQHMSWISIDDACGVIQHAIASPDVEGPVNAVAPNPVTNREFTKTLGRVLSRPTIAPMPGIVARLAFGEMAKHLLLASAKVLPKRLSASGYRFRHPTLEPALRHLLGR